MTQSKHTPGTWYYDDDLLAVVVVNGHKLKAVADFGKCDLPESRANAHLIAAAPDLLEALETAALVIQSGMACNDIETRTAAFNKATAAIAKAKGE